MLQTTILLYGKKKNNNKKHSTLNLRLKSLVAVCVNSTINKILTELKIHIN